MIYRFDIVEVPPVILAVTEAQVKQSEIPSLILGMFDVVYSWLRESGVEQTGHNYALYDCFTKEGMRMRVGFPVSRRFADGERVHCLELPTGRAAHTTHVGAYAGLPDAHRQLNTWCAGESLELAGIAWEVYGDWHQDSSRLVTDVYLRLK